ncbi:MAG: glycosyltransferase [Parcubacteria group bacterium]|nr:glycosyltransferase [Parcubacteria group bacterium]
MKNELNNEPIDIVYTWVDGSDPEWQKKRDEAFKKFKGNFTENGISPGRFQNHDELKYSLRSIDQYMRWVRKIFIVTDNQIPKWLDTNNPKITIVDHKDIFPKYVKTPVFNSSLIEFFIPYIKNLSDKFICFNDDFLVNKPLNKSDFFTPDNKPIFFSKNIGLDLEKPKINFINIEELNSEAIDNIIKFFNTRENISWYDFENSFELFHMEHPEITDKLYIKHAPYTIIKKDQIDILKRYEKFIEKNISNQFRTKHELNFWELYELNCLQKKLGVISDNENDLFEFGMGSKYYQQDIQEILEIFNPKYKFISVSQGETYNEKYIEAAIIALELRYPRESTFEKKCSTKHINRMGYLFDILNSEYVNEISGLKKEIIEKEEKHNKQIELLISAINEKNEIILKNQEHLDEIYNARVWKIYQHYLSIRGNLINLKRYTNNVENGKNDEISILGNQLNNSLGSNKEKNVYIFSGVPYWDIGGGQRSSQLTKTFNIMGYSVHYIYAFESSDKSEHLKINLPLTSHEHIQKFSLNKSITKDNSIFIFELPYRDYIPFLDFALKNNIFIIYEHIDNWDSSLGNTFFSDEIFQTFLEYSSLINITSKNLSEKINSKYNNKLSYSPNGVDIDLFNPNNNYLQPNDLIIGDKTLIYYGSLWGDWFDWDLIISLANSNKKFSINLIGDIPNNLQINEFPKNIHFLGLKPQRDLPNYLKYSDWALLPFKADTIGKYVSPLKIFEYISMGKPILSTKLPEVQTYPNVFSGNNIQSWIANLQDKNISIVDTTLFTLQNSWYQRCQNILKSANFFYNFSVPKISVIVLNYNNKLIIDKCIDNLIFFNSYNYEIIIVDNNSSDNSFEYLKSKYKDKIKIFQNPKNGCSSGRNLGILKANGEYVLFLDSDQYPVSSKWLDVPIYSILNYQNIESISWAGGFITNQDFGGPIGEYAEDKLINPSLLFRTNIDYLGSGGMLIKKSTLKRVNYFDEKYDPSCFEDTDLAFKIKNTGGTIAYCPYELIVHNHHQTTNVHTDSYKKLFKKNSKYFDSKWGLTKKIQIKKIKNMFRPAWYAFKPFLIKVKNYRDNLFFGRLISKINQKNSLKIIALPTLDWNTSLYQRPQHLAKQLSRKLIYFYGSGNYGIKEIDGIKEREKMLYLTNKWELLLKYVKNPWIFLLSTQQFTTINEINKYKSLGHKIIYDYVDEIHEEISGSKKMADFLLERHNFIKKSKIADLVLCVSNKLYKEMLTCYPKDRVLLVQNGVEYDHFQLKKNINKVPKDLKNIVKSKKPIIGYYGAIAKWIDYDLINETAIMHPEWNFVLIGVDYDKSLSILKELNNIFFLGSKTYQELPKYAIWFDIATIPFVRGEIAKATSPLKFYEYMAMGKPTIITEDLEDCISYQGVFISKNNSDDFSNQIQKALDVRNDKTYITNCKKIAKNNTWESRAEQIYRHLCTIQ